jgi:hypothetical protein
VFGAIVAAEAFVQVRRADSIIGIVLGVMAILAIGAGVVGAHPLSYSEGGG